MRAEASCPTRGCSASAISAINLLSIALPNVLKVSATITNELVRRRRSRGSRHPDRQQGGCGRGRVPTVDALSYRIVARRNDTAPGIVGAVTRHIDCLAYRVVWRTLQLRHRKVDTGADRSEIGKRA